MQGQVISVGMVVGICVTLAAFTAIAGDDSDRKRKPERSIDVAQMKAGAAERFAELDADSDGKVTPEEFAAAHGDRGKDAGDKAARKGKDRKVRERMRERRGEMRQRREMLSGPVFDAADGDGDGKLSKEEFKQLPRAARAVAQRRAFDRLDADGDGALAVGEMMSPRIAMLEKADADGDGKVSGEEMRALRKAHASEAGEKKRGWRKIRKSRDADADKSE